MPAALVAAAATDVFSRTPSTTSLGAALRDLRAEKPKVRTAAALALAHHAQKHRAEVTEALMEALDDANADVRAASALGLADAKADQAVPALIEACDDPDDHVRQMAITALSEIGGATALARIERALTDHGATIRFQAVMAFPRMSDDRERSVQVLLTATHDQDALVRHIALRMAEELGGDDDGPVPLLMQDRAVELLDDEAAAVRVAAAVVLARSGRRDGAHILVAVASREVITTEADDEAAALELIGQLQLQEAIPCLEKRGFKRVILLQNDPFAWQARVALAAMGHARAIDWVVRELNAWTRERRCLGVAAASRARVMEARPLLLTMRGNAARADPDAIEEAIERLERG